MLHKRPIVNGVLRRSRARSREKVDKETRRLAQAHVQKRRSRGGRLGIGSPPAQYFRWVWFFSRVSRVSRVHRQQEEANPSHVWASLGRDGRWSWWSGGLVVQHPCLRSSGEGTSQRGKGPISGSCRPRLIRHLLLRAADESCEGEAAKAAGKQAC